MLIILSILLFGKKKIHPVARLLHEYIHKYNKNDIWNNMYPFQDFMIDEISEKCNRTFICRGCFDKINRDRVEYNCLCTYCYNNNINELNESSSDDD